MINARFGAGRPPAGNALAFVLQYLAAFVPDRCLLKIRVAVVCEQRLAPRSGQSIFSSFVPLDLQRFLRFLQTLGWRVVGVYEREPARGLSTVAPISPQLRRFVGFPAMAPAQKRQHNVNAATSNIS
jgi:hypothetical protein